MASGFAFKCNLNSSGPELCFFGGVCQELNESTNQQEFCVCPQGYGHDFTLFHTPNCALPSLALEVFAGVFSMMWLMVLVWYLNKVRNLKGKTKVLQLSRIGLADLISMECLVIGLVTQYGFFEVSLVMFCVCLLCLNLLVQMVTIQMFQFAHAMYSTRVNQMKLVLNYGLVAYIVVMVISCGFSLAFAQTNEVWKFDAALCGLLLSNYLALVVLSLHCRLEINE
jgi:hypothetical protein